MGPISSQLHVGGAGNVKHFNGLAASPFLPSPPHCLTPFPELPAAHSAGFVMPLPVKASSWPSEQSHIPRSGTHALYTVGPTSSSSHFPHDSFVPACAPYSQCPRCVCTFPPLHLCPGRSSFPISTWQTPSCLSRSTSNGTFFLRPFVLHSNLMSPLPPPWQLRYLNALFFESPFLLFSLQGKNLSLIHPAPSSVFDM